MRRRILVFASFLILTGITQRIMQAGQIPGWQRVSDGVISVYTQGDPAQAVPLLETFSQLRSALLQAGAFPVGESTPLKVIVFTSEQEFNRYRLNAASCAFYQQTRRAEYIVLQDLAPAHREVSAHEFTHFLLAHSGYSLPLWLNEGLADFYSTFQVSPDGAGLQVSFGRSVADRLAQARSNVWLPLAELFQISNTSSYYSNSDKMALFYSESWALTHMLLTSSAYAPHVRDLLRALQHGQPAAESFQAIYDRTLAQVQDELVSYLDRQHLPITEVRLTAKPAALSSSVASVSDEEMSMTLADLIPNAAEGRLASAASQISASAASEESLGFRALRQGATDEARIHFQLAVDRHSDDANVFFYLAHLEHEAGAPSSKVLPLLDQALALDPDLADARLEWALIAAHDRDFIRALAALEKLTAPRPENAYAAVYTKAYCYAHLERLNEARNAAERARSMARTNRDLAQVGELITFIGQQQAEYVAPE